VKFRTMTSRNARIGPSRCGASDPLGSVGHISPLPLPTTTRSRPAETTGDAFRTKQLHVDPSRPMLRNSAMLEGGPRRRTRADEA